MFYTGNMTSLRTDTHMKFFHRYMNLMMTGALVLCVLCVVLFVKEEYRRPQDDGGDGAERGGEGQEQRHE